MSDITLGIIGSGQLGSLLCQAAKKLNVKTVVISETNKVLHKIILMNLFILNTMMKAK